MSGYYEAEGPSLGEMRDKGRDLHHMRIYGGSDASPEKPSWSIGHYTSEDDENPQEYNFTDGQKVMDHIREHASIPVKPTAEDLKGANTTGRARGKEQY